jgi:hypothetical protein
MRRMCPMSRRVRTLITALACGAALAAHAELSDEIQVYTDDINAPGEFGLELHVNATPSGRRAPNYPGEVTPHHGWRLTPEFSYGLSRDWEAGLYLPASRDAAGNAQLAGAKVRLKWLPVHADDAGGWFFGANAELSRLKAQFSESRTSAELRVMAGWRDAKWLVAVNPVFGWNLSGALRSGTPDMSLGTKVARNVAEAVALGLEYYSELGTARHLQWSSRQPQELFAAVDAKVRGIDINFGIGRGLNAASDKWTVKAIVGVPL